MAPCERSEEKSISVGATARHSFFVGVKSPKSKKLQTAGLIFQVQACVELAGQRGIRVALWCRHPGCGPGGAWRVLAGRGNGCRSR